VLSLLARVITPLSEEVTLMLADQNEINALLECERSAPWPRRARARESPLACERGPRTRGCGLIKIWETETLGRKQSRTKRGKSEWYSWCVQYQLYTNNIHSKTRLPKVQRLTMMTPPKVYDDTDTNVVYLNRAQSLGKKD